MPKANCETVQKDIQLLSTKNKNPVHEFGISALKTT